MELDHEERILRNPALTARAFWHFARSYSDHASDRAPELPYFLIVAAMIFHRDTVEQIRSMQFNSGLLKAIGACPDINAGLQARLEESALTSLKALQVGCASRILQRVEGPKFPSFQALGQRLPAEIRASEASVSDIFACTRRLGTWLAADGEAILKSRLKLEF